MFEIKELGKALKQVADEKGLAPEKVLEAVEAALAAAYKKEYKEKGDIVRAKLDMQTGEMNFWQVKLVVDPSEVRIITDEELLAETEAEANKEKEEKPKEISEEEKKIPRYNSERHIFLEDAKKIKKDVELGEELTFPLEVHEDFGRIAAQIARQTIVQKLRDSERESVIKEWQGKEGTIISGIIQRFDRGNVYIDLGRATGVMFANETIPGEHYRMGERLRFFVLSVQEDTRLPGIVLSRSHPRFVSKLFEMEVPEIADGTVEIKAITREAGNRTKLAVFSSADGVDPIGACVGQRGTRVMAVNNELGQEKIDIVEWDENPEKFIVNSLSPAKPESVEILGPREARVYVPEDQLSLAIGRGGQNVRMSAKLTGWRIDVRSKNRPEEVLDGGVAEAAVDAPSEDSE